tara:strand:+ start:50 stop:859 length:810 start_codon:yes stop_codon:yes gene_type:complete
MVNIQSKKKLIEKLDSKALALKNNIFMLQYYKMIESTDICIPKNVYQCWISKFKKIPKCIQESLSILRDQNKNFNFHFFDDQMCSNFIRDNFNKEVVDAYEKFIPEAYKADLWRYCIMYIKGGIYIDCKFIMHENNTLDCLLYNEYYVRDIPRYDKEEYIYQALLVAKPGNKLFLKCINQIVTNVNSRNVGSGPLDVTGPHLIAYQIRENISYLVNRGKFNILDLKNVGNGNISYKDKLFLKIHKKKDYYSNVDKNNRYGTVYPYIYKN